MSRPLAAHDPLVPLYHPTSVILLDDDPVVLHAMTMQLQGDFQYFAFKEAGQALAHVRKQWLFDAAQATDMAAPLGTMEHIRDPAERALYMKAARLPRVFADAGRFGRTSVIVADEVLADPSFLHEMRNFPFRKVLLADDVDDGAAGRALRDGLVDAVLPTHSPNTYHVLADRLHRLQLDFFSTLTHPIVPALASTDTRFLQDADVRAAFQDFVSEHAIIEHCACLHPPGILGLDRAGNPLLMMVVDDDYRQAAFEIAHAERAPTELLRRLASGEAIAVFPTRSGFYANGLAVDWRDCLWDARKLGANGWCSAIVDAPDVTRIVCGSITSYDSYRRRWLS